MSTPRVGSSSTSAAGRFTMAAAMATFCWLPPLSERMGVPRDGALTRNVSRTSCAIDAHPAASQRATGAADLVAQPGHDVVADRQVREQAGGRGRRTRSRSRPRRPRASRARPPGVCPSPARSPRWSGPARARPSPPRPRMRRPRRRPPAGRRPELATPCVQPWSSHHRRGVAASRDASAPDPYPGRPPRPRPAPGRWPPGSGSRPPASSDALPSRMTTTRSRVRTSSASRWLTRMTTRPASASACIRRKRSFDSSSVSAELGSSNRNTRASWTSARAISVRWWMASGTSSEQAVPDVVDAQVAHHAELLLAQRRGAASGCPSRPTMTLSPTVRLGNSCGSWCTTATRWTPMSTDHGSPSTRISPVVGGGLRGEDLDHRALAGAVGPGDTQDLPRVRVEVEPVERDGVAVVLAQAPDADARRRPPRPRCSIMCALRLRWVYWSSTTAPMVTVPSRICWANGPADEQRQAVRQDRQQQRARERARPRCRGRRTGSRHR